MNRSEFRNYGKSCPVCRGDSRPLLELPAQPIYQHPVDADAVVPPPYTIDLSWVACVDCAHAWQPQFDANLLEKIYRQHYYTPAPDGLAVQFRDDFLSTLESFGLLKTRRAIIEIGASSGDALAAVKARTGAMHALAFEPDVRNAALARQRGLEVSEQFFGAAIAPHVPVSADLIYARHVIEHIFDFSDFFAGLDAVSSRDADLVLETPSLDHHARDRNLVPFHVEHVHVFSLRSLVNLCRSHGWHLARNFTTIDGNLIASFSRAPGRGTSAGEPPPPDFLDEMQNAQTRYSARLRELLADRRLVFWGAGSAGVWIVSLIGREPDFWTDGNPEKIGKKFVGCARRIVSPQEAIAGAAIQAGDAAIMMIASSFAREILPRVREMGWKGEIVDLAGNHL